MPDQAHTLNQPNKAAVVLLSGGLDSSTVLAFAQSEGYPSHALTFDYGQRNRFELQAAARVARALGAVEHRLLKLDLRSLGGSSLTTDMDVERGRTFAEIGRGIPSTYVPARNTIFLSYALAWAEVLDAGDIFIGVNAVDTSGYPDCRPEFISAFEQAARLGTRMGSEGEQGLRIHTPLQALTKSQIVLLGTKLGIDYSLTATCYDPDPQGLACGTCDSCRLRQRGFIEAGLEDPLPYRSRLSHDKTAIASNLQP